MTSVAAQKTAGVLGDDLALNAQQLMGISAERELPVVWAVAKGSWKNKLILVPTALAISYFLPAAVQPLLMIGGLYLCYEGVEKLAHKFLHSKHEDDAHHKELIEAMANPSIDMVTLEKEKIAGAVRTDFVLSAEIITLALATVADKSFPLQVTVLFLVAILMTVGVYGFVAIIVKLDDAGLYMSLKKGSGRWPRVQRSIGHIIIASAPYLLKTLSFVGTIAMFVVGGGIVAHGFHWLNETIHSIAHSLGSTPWIGGLLDFLTGFALNGLVGVLAGILVLATVLGVSRLFRKTRDQA